MKKIFLLAVLLPFFIFRGYSIEKGSEEKIGLMQSFYQPKSKKDFLEGTILRIRKQTLIQSAFRKNFEEKSIVVDILRARTFLEKEYSELKEEGFIEKYELQEILEVLLKSPNSAEIYEMKYLRLDLISVLKAVCKKKDLDLDIKEMLEGVIPYFMTFLSCSLYKIPKGIFWEFCWVGNLFFTMCEIKTCSKRYYFEELLYFFSGKRNSYY